MWGQCFIEKFCYFLPYSVMVFYYEQRFGRMSYFMNLVIGASQLQPQRCACGDHRLRCLRLLRGADTDPFQLPVRHPTLHPPAPPPTAEGRASETDRGARPSGRPLGLWNRAECRAACASSIEVISTFGQTNPDLTSGMLETCRIVYRTQGGLPAFWRGMSGYIMVAARPAISQGVFDQTKRFYLERTGRPITALLTFNEALVRRPPRAACRGRLPG